MVSESISGTFIFYSCISHCEKLMRDVFYCIDYELMQF